MNCHKNVFTVFLISLTITHTTHHTRTVLFAWLALPYIHDLPCAWSLTYHYMHISMPIKYIFKDYLQFCITDTINHTQNTAHIVPRYDLLCLGRCARAHIYIHIFITQRCHWTQDPPVSGVVLLWSIRCFSLLTHKVHMSVKHSQLLPYPSEQTVFDKWHLVIPDTYICRHTLLTYIVRLESDLCVDLPGRHFALNWSFANS